MAPHIQTPVEGFTGVVAGVNFANGVGDTDDPAALEYFARQGYTIGEPSAASDGDSGKGLSPKQKLQAEATALGLDAEGTKDEIAARIAEHKAKVGKAEPHAIVELADGSTPEVGADGIQILPATVATTTSKASE